MDPRINQLVSAGVRFYLDSSGSLRWRAPRRLTTDERAIVAREKESIMATLQEAAADKTEPAPEHHNRATTQAELLRLYEILGTTYTAADWQELSLLPGWTDQLRELEDKFTEVWQSDGDCKNELETLHNHWRVGIRAIQPQREPQGVAEYIMANIQAEGLYRKTFPQVARYLKRELAAEDFELVSRTYWEKCI